MSNPDARRPRWGSSVYELGDDPDYRFSLANERTFLAWIRTALALIAGGIAVIQLLPGLEPVWLRRAAGLLPALLGALLGGLSFRRWQRYERAIRIGGPLPPSTTPRLLAWAVLAGGLAIAVLLLLVDAPS